MPNRVDTSADDAEEGEGGRGGRGRYPGEARLDGMERVQYPTFIEWPTLRRKGSQADPGRKVSVSVWRKGKAEHTEDGEMQVGFVDELAERLLSQRGSSII